MVLPIEEPLKPEDRAYLAGLIDCNGSIFMKLRRRREWVVRLKLCGLSEAQQGWLLGLSLIRFSGPPVPGGEIVLEGIRTIRILTSCFYFLKTTREKARLALEFGQTRPGPGHARKMSPEELEVQAKIAARLSELNRGAGQRVPSHDADAKPEGRRGVSS